MSVTVEQQTAAVTVDPSAASVLVEAAPPAQVSVSQDGAQVSIQQVAPASVVLECDPASVTIQAQPPASVVIDAQTAGPPGPPGVGGTSTDVVRTSATALSANRVVRDTSDGVHVGYADPSLSTGVLGITRYAVSAAEQPTTVVLLGELTDSGWSWTQGPVFLGASGVLTQTPPATGAVLQVAEALSPTRIVVTIKERVLRA